VTSRRVLIWRHGRTEWNAQRRFQGQADPGLDQVGQAQAWKAAAMLATFRADVIVSSDLIRASQTAQVLATVTGSEVMIDARLRERSLGHWEGLTREQVEVTYPDEFAQWRDGRDVSGRGGETRQQVADRSMAAFADLPEVPVVILVTHSATAIALTTAMLGLEQSVHVISPLANCHWTELTREVSSWRLRAHNVGPAGPVIPHPITEITSADSPDAEAMDAESN
jgi:broad specificity phosphatase PhoE